ncbi:uncharacterized protein LOC105398625 [Plutella xylostella]|uniref:uncharacterized protein LOC105398625 n=1 Tax=Plutella xylostella TaxID=51655 RepID=UPI0020327E3B|nr:uncharacterized protein LOC105398625 [Plutella xylostella]
MSPLKLVLCLGLVHMVYAKGTPSRVECSPNMMKVTVPMDGDRKMTYLDKMKYYKPCVPTMDGDTASYSLDLQEPFTCGVYKVLNKITGTVTYYHKIVIEDTLGGREVVTARCVQPPPRNKREVGPTFPLDFNEPDELNITRYEEGHAPEPILGAVVKQNGKEVSGEISVSPGTPLAMDIFLDNSSAPVYGLSVGYMHVTDTGAMQETIILNGCSVDPYLFDNFITTTGDVLTAKFRAFKFPDTTYVQFRGTVTVCLDKCQGVQCSNGVTGYGRRRRAIAGTASNKVYEVSLTTFIKVDWTDGEKEAEDVLGLLKNLQIANQVLGDKEGTQATIVEKPHPWSHHNLTVHTSGSPRNYVNYFMLLVLSCVSVLLK